MTEFDPVLVHDWLSRTARRLPDKVALVCGKRRLTYSEIDKSSSLAAKELAQLGIKRGDRVVIFMGNCVEAVVAIYGVLMAGGVFVVAEAPSTGSTLRHLIRDSGASAIIAHVDQAPVLKEALRDQRYKGTVIWIGQGRHPVSLAGDSADWQDLQKGGKDAAALPRIIDIDLASLIYTSGSTGPPKGIMCTHHNMVSAARSIIQYLKNDQRDVIVDVLPLAFDYGLYQVIMAFMFGGTVVLERSAAYLEPLIQTIEKEKVTGFPVVPTITAMLLRMKRFPSERLRSLRYITSTGAAWPAAHIQKIREFLPHVTLFSMYGLTECKRVGFLPPDLIDKKPESVGMAMPNSEAMIVGRKGEEVRRGSAGELVVRGSNIMQGYWADSAASKRVFRKGRYPADRLLHTGDWFRLGEDGLLYFVGRHDDLIKSFGRRVSPREVEGVVASMPGISEAVAIGVPEEINGQVIGIFAVAQKSGIDGQKVQAFCRKLLEAYKIPKYVWFVDSLPKTPNGKTDKKRLIETAANNLRISISAKKRAKS
jgi:amino acid adenylation domain-containing protein